jgi:hypothetical protein
VSERSREREGGTGRIAIGAPPGPRRVSRKMDETVFGRRSRLAPRASAGFARERGDDARTYPSETRSRSAASSRCTRSSSSARRRLGRQRRRGVNKMEGKTRKGRRFRERKVARLRDGNADAPAVAAGMKLPDVLGPSTRVFKRFPPRASRPDPDAKHASIFPSLSRRSTRK